MNRCFVLAALLSAFSAVGFAQDQRTMTTSSVNRMYGWSVASLIAANALDAASSWNRPERNSFLAGSNGRFDARSLGLKTGLVAGQLVSQYFVVRGDGGKRKRVFAVMNFAAAGVLTAVATRNISLRIR